MMEKVIWRLDAVKLRLLASKSQKMRKDIMKRMIANQFEKVVVIRSLRDDTVE
ncbi:hypothetical protein [Ekhidna sp.]|uniref:hypothetical protein n=1 Tax=Ekhidna sp. TaxID=2608089 RepID=UPI0032968D8E